jgi:hypothetical protein
MSNISIHKLSNKQSVPSRLASKARAERIWRFNQTLDPVFLDLYRCYVGAQHWDELSPTERILAESKWTETILRLLSIGNKGVMHSLGYRLREQTLEEDEDENAS